MTKKLLLALCLTLTACANPAQISTAKVTAKGSIVGGADAPANSIAAASTVALMRNSLGGFKQFCTGTLVSKNLVLTASHCLKGRSASQFVVYLGANLPDSESAPGVMRVASTKIHPEYELGSNEGRIYRDIGFLKLADEIPANAKPAPILDPSYALNEGSSILLAGFGLTAEPPAFVLPNKLQFTHAPLAKIDNTLAVIDQRAGHGACSGDSGGPLYLEGAGKIFVFGATRGPYAGATDCKQFGSFTYVSLFKNYALATATELGADAPEFAKP